MGINEVKAEGEKRKAETARAVFLDRDGVINRALVRDGQPYPPASLAEFEILRVSQLRAEAQGLADTCIFPR